MKAFHCLFWATLYCVLYLVRASSEDELLDFDFAEAKEVATAWNYEQDAKLVNAQAEAIADAAEKKRIESNLLDFTVEMEDDDPQQHLPPFDWREKVLRNALAKALTDRALRQKFAEVMPILRVLTSQQRLALSALISAQMNAKPGHELKLQQVRMMFQDDKKLLLPIVYDLANLVKNSARKFIHFGNDLNNAELRQSANERNFDLTSTEEAAEDSDVGTIRVTADKPGSEELEDFFEKMPVDLLDPQSINEELQAVKDEQQQQQAQRQNSTTTTANTTTTTTITIPPKPRIRRAANEFVHKLVRSMPASVNEEDLLRGIAGRTIRLNTTAFEQPNEHTPPAPPSTTSAVTTTIQSSTSSSLAPSIEPAATQSYVEIEDIAFAELNGTEFQLNPNERLDKMNGDELLPNPEELIAGPRYRLAGGNKLHTNNNNNNNLRNKSPIKRKRVQARGRPKGSAPPPPPPHSTTGVAPAKKCERFTATMCIYTEDYPLDQIMGSIRRHKNAMSALLAEFYDKPNQNLEFGEEFDDYVVNKKRREDEGSAGGMCQSIVRYARPQKARSASGEWKYIVNTGQHTQTLRLEKCSNAGESCSYLAQTYRSHCAQVYNYHRLLSWDKLRGLHVDIFKVPTCCSCQVDGYRQQFPPLSSLQSKDFTPANYHGDKTNGYSTINEDDLDYNDESDEDELGYVPASYSSNGIGHQQQHKPSSQYEGNELFLSSKKVRTKVHAPPTVGSYLSPPDDEYRDAEYGHKSAGRGTHATTASGAASHKKHYSHVSRRRPHNEPRVDLDLSPSEAYADKEVNIFGTPLAASNDKSRQVSQKRKRIYSAPHSASAGGGGGAAASLSASSVSSAFEQPATVATSTAVNRAAHAHQIHYQQQQHQQQSNFISAATATASAAAAAAAAGASTATSAPPSPNGHFNRNFIGSFGGQSRPRFYAPGSLAPQPGTVVGGGSSSSVASSPATSSSTESVYQQRYGAQSTALPATPSIYHHVNAIFSSGAGSGGIVGTYNTSHAQHSPNAKRINYSYHPIIDFFDKNKRADFTTNDESTETVEQPNPALIYPHKIPSTAVTSSSSASSAAAAGGVGGGVGVYQNSHERRIGFGAGAGGAGGVGGIGVGGFHHAPPPFANDNAWRPVVVAPLK